ncbi:MAG TPA: hypothetical protein VFQ52_09150 [Rhizomicrobium sp.]|nr:hypothetical protein [Rhizomicrobium sp.]
MDVKTLSLGATGWFCAAMGVCLLLLLAQTVGASRLRLRQADSAVARTVQEIQATVRARVETLFNAVGDLPVAIIAFSGTRDGMSLVAPRGAAGTSDLRRFSLGLTMMGEVAHSCCVDLNANCSCPYLPHGGDEILLRRVSGLSLAYFDADPLDTERGAWRDSWAGPAPPSLIRLRVMFPTSDARWWPDLIIETPMRPALTRPVGVSSQPRMGYAG